MSTSEQTHSEPIRSSIGQPALSLAITFLLIGLTFAIPVQLIPPERIGQVSTQMANEVGNVYAVVAWAGLAHFFYAYRGQLKSKRTTSTSLKMKTLALIALTVLALWLLRSWIGYGAFGALTWSYFILHFYKAEMFFEGRSTRQNREALHVVVTFSWLSIVLLNPLNIIGTPWIIWLASLGLGCAVLADGGLKRLTDGDPKSALLSLFFVAESLVWGTYGRYGGSAFLFGVYVFHIAAGSYYHYLGAYFAGFSLSNHRDRWLSLGRVTALNMSFIAIGVAVSYFDAMAWLSPVFGVSSFTLWVAAHLVTSDIFPRVFPARG